MKISVLDVGSGARSVVEELFGEEASVIKMDANPDTNPDYVHDIREPFPEELHNRFDIVLGYHVLPCVEREAVFQSGVHMAQCVRPGGEMWLSAPSLEWICKQPGKGRGLLVQQLLHGSQQTEFDIFKSSFMLEDLRLILINSGMVLRKAYQTPILFQSEGEEVLSAVQNVAIGTRPPDSGAEDDAAGKVGSSTLVDVASS